MILGIILIIILALFIYSISLTEEENAQVEEYKSTKLTNTIMDYDDIDYSDIEEENMSDIREREDIEDEEKI